jgi:hypothetical protein
MLSIEKTLNFCIFSKALWRGFYFITRQKSIGPAPQRPSQIKMSSKNRVVDATFSCKLHPIMDTILHEFASTFFSA